MLPLYVFFIKRFILYYGSVSVLNIWMDLYYLNYKEYKYCITICFDVAPELFYNEFINSTTGNLRILCWCWLIRLKVRCHWYCFQTTEITQLSESVGFVSTKIFYLYYQYILYIWFLERKPTFIEIIYCNIESFIEKCKHCLWLCLVSTLHKFGVSYSNNIQIDEKIG